MKEGLSSKTKPFSELLKRYKERTGCSFFVAPQRRTNLSGVVVPQLLVQPVGMGFLPLDLSDDVKNLGVGAAGAAAAILV